MKKLIALVVLTTSLAIAKDKPKKIKDHDLVQRHEQALIALAPIISDYDDTITALIKAVHELQQEVDYLERRLTVKANTNSNKDAYGEEANK